MKTFICIGLVLCVVFAYAAALPATDNSEATEDQFDVEELSAKASDDAEVLTPEESRRYGGWYGGYGGGWGYGRGWGYGGGWGRGWGHHGGYRRWGWGR